jgi:hypothetical protein
MKVDLTYQEFKDATQGQNVQVFYIRDKSGAVGDAVFQARTVVKNITLNYASAIQPASWALDFPLAVEVDGLADTE